MIVDFVQRNSKAAATQKYRVSESRQEGYLQLPALILETCELFQSTSNCG